jgi:hypothetical protein
MYSMRRGLARPLVFSALGAFLLGTLATFCAGLFDGFIIPAFATKYAVADAMLQQQAVETIALCAVVVQVATVFAIAVQCVAIVLWSIDLLSERGPRRWTGAFGIAAGIAGIAIVAAAGTLGPHTVIFVALPLLAWYLAAGALMMRGVEPRLVSA